MQAPRYVETNLDTLRYRERSLQLHQLKLQHIKGRHLSPSVLDFKPRVRTVGYLEAERLESIRRENESLMSKLVTISETKNVRKTLQVLEPKSLNTRSRREAIARIRAENATLSRRLQAKSALISKKRMDQEYSRSSKYRRQISRARLLNVPTRSLPPLRSSKREELSKTASSQREKSPVAGLTLAEYMEAYAG